MKSEKPVGKMCISDGATRCRRGAQPRDLRTDSETNLGAFPAIDTSHSVTWSCRASWQRQTMWNDGSPTSKGIYVIADLSNGRPYGGLPRSRPAARGAGGPGRYTGATCQAETEREQLRSELLGEAQTLRTSDERPVYDWTSREPFQVHNAIATSIRCKFSNCIENPHHNVSYVVGGARRWTMGLATGAPVRSVDRHAGMITDWQLAHSSPHTLVAFTRNLGVFCY